jgi:4-hydroxybenzoate polyprenyltransferase
VGIAVTEVPSARSQLLAYMQLFRLPNVFTAVADVLLGFVLTHDGTFEPGRVLALLVGASCLMYLAGMVLNDVFDQAIDARERPHRPIPSGRIHPAFARTLGVTMLVLGAALGALASRTSPDWRPAIVAVSLALTVLLYDRALKQTFLGPIAMGGCRMLNVLLGMSASPEPWSTQYVLIAAGVGIYIAGVTWFARTEARDSSRAQLAVASVVMVAGLALAAAQAHWINWSPVQSFNLACHNSGLPAGYCWARRSCGGQSPQSSTPAPNKCRTP